MALEALEHCRKMLEDREALPKEEGDLITEYKAMHEDNFFSSRLRKDLEGKAEDMQKVNTGAERRRVQTWEEGA